MVSDDSSMASDENSVPDLTPQQLNDPTVHIRNVFRSFCTTDFDLGDHREPRVVPIGTYSRGAALLAKDMHAVSSYIDMSQQGARVTRQIPQHTSMSTSPQERLSFYAVQRSAPRPQSILRRPSQKRLKPVTDVPERRTRRVIDTLLGTVVTLLLTAAALRQLGFSLDVALHINDSKLSKRAIQFSKPQPRDHVPVQSTAAVEPVGVALDWDEAGRTLKSHCINEVVTSRDMKGESILPQVFQDEAHCIMEATKKSPAL